MQRQALLSTLRDTDVKRNSSEKSFLLFSKLSLTFIFLCQYLQDHSKHSLSFCIANNSNIISWRSLTCLTNIDLHMLPSSCNGIILQIEWLTAGDCIAGMHEVVVTSRTMDAVAAASKQNRSLWRVSSTVSINMGRYCRYLDNCVNFIWTLQCSV